MLLYLLKFVIKFVAGILIQKAFRFLATVITHPPRRSAGPGPRPKAPKKSKANINPKNIVDGRFEDISE